MKVTIALILLICFSLASPLAKIDPELLKQFEKPRLAMATAFDEEYEFIVWYNSSSPPVKGRAFEHFPFAFSKASKSEIMDLASRDDVIYIFANKVYKAVLNETVNTSSSLIGAYESYDASGVKVAVLDTGVNWSIPALQGVSHMDMDFTGWDGKYNASDDHGHGTFVTSEIVSNDSIYLGLARNATILNAKVLAPYFFYAAGTTADILAGLDWAVDSGASVISMSLGQSLVGFGNRPVDPLVAAMQYLPKNVTVVVSAGNDGPSNYTISSPAYSRRVIAVGALNKNGMLASYSSRLVEWGAPKPEVCATGQIYAFYKDGSIIEAEGTSMSAPLVSALSTIIIRESREKGLSLDWPYLKGIILSTAEPDQAGCGWGRINVSKAIDWIRSGKAFLVQYDPSFKTTGWLGFVGNETRETFALIVFGNVTNSICQLNITENGHLLESTSFPLNNSTYLTNFNLTISGLSQYGTGRLDLETNCSDIILESPLYYSPAKQVSMGNSGLVQGTEYWKVTQPVTVLVNGTFLALDYNEEFDGLYTSCYFTDGTNNECQLDPGIYIVNGTFNYSTSPVESWFGTFTKELSYDTISSDYFMDTYPVDNVYLAVHDNSDNLLVNISSYDFELIGSSDPGRYVTIPSTGEYLVLAEANGTLGNNDVEFDIVYPGGSTSEVTLSAEYGYAGLILFLNSGTNVTAKPETEQVSFSSFYVYRLENKTSTVGGDLSVNYSDKVVYLQVFSTSLEAFTIFVPELSVYNSSASFTLYLRDNSTGTQIANASNLCLGLPLKIAITTENGGQVTITDKASQNKEIVYHYNVNPGQTSLVIIPEGTNVTVSLVDGTKQLTKDFYLQDCNTTNLARSEARNLIEALLQRLLKLLRWYLG